MNLGDYICQHVLCPDSKGEAILGLIPISLSTLKLFVSWRYVFACHWTKSWAVPGKILQLFLTLYSFPEKDSCFPFCSQRYGCLTINFWNETPRRDSLPPSLLLSQCSVSLLGLGGLLPWPRTRNPTAATRAAEQCGNRDRHVGSASRFWSGCSWWCL